ncbi:chemotaxis protein CheA [Novosphingobium ginsenosidimutans]|uniref:Chemotaxis protein CheA n=1 Tax=Novosphingobium ginsenosidimutans TaxID=1176536 RepID=A0A5B8S5I5_9SPHN|nr:chemotaxis protein CheW [Novosphingobium ginsenosidimutans]QEA16653.1 chemotaxis protein CheA [Novosphingobium ginsenosidimutans]
MDDLITEFIAETREMLQALERGLVAWERDPADRERLSEIFRFVHTVKGNCGFFDLPRLAALAHAAEDALGEVRAGKRAIDSSLVDAVLAVVDRIGEMIEAIAAGEDIAGGDDSDLIARFALVQPEPMAVEPVVPPVKAAPAREPFRSVRLPTSLVDRVMSGVSDMILVRNELERQLRKSDDDPALIANFGRLSSLLSEMQAAMARVRMQPISTLFDGYQRMIRDLTAELGKQVEVEIESGQVELDREMIELLRDPLLHVIRNAIDHGIETPAERQAAGKRPEGRLMLSARQTGNEIRIAILDDGRGIDAGQVAARAVERGIVTAEQAARMETAQKLMLICEPGLSTAREVTAISGRGVGMDVVRASIERIGGKLRIVSAPGEGTRFLLDVPLTLSIVPSITVEVGDQVFAVPRSYVREIVRNGHDVEAERIGGMRHVRVRGELYPCLGLGALFGIACEADPERQVLVMVTMIDGSVFALCVDDIADHCDLVIRPVAPQVIATGLYVGVAQLNDGRPALMLDLVGVSQLGGIASDKQSRIVTEPAAVEEARELAAMIVFDGFDGQRRAVPLEQVERLVEVPAGAIGRSGDAAHIVFEETIIPLHGLDRQTAAQSIDVLVLADQGRRFAYATGGAVDTSDIDLATVTTETGRRLALLDGHSIELLDLATPLDNQPTCHLPDDDAWTRTFLRPLVESAGYRIVEQSRPADLAIRIDSARSDSVVIGDQGLAVARGDVAALKAALQLASQRKAS